MPETPTYGFPYETPQTKPGITLTGDTDGSSPILAEEVETALAATDANVAQLSGLIAANEAAIAELQSRVQQGIQTVTFAATDVHTENVVFPVVFAGQPNVMVNIHSGAGAAARWDARAISVTPSQFTLFVFSNASGSTNAWTDIQVMWTATYWPAL